MRTRALLLPLTLFAALFASPARSSPEKQPVIIELFTSEGCSSCPPADALLKELSEQQPFEGVQIIALEEHVDYWNSQGWKDPFSSADFTQRQKDYAGIFSDATVYTPQLVIDGRAEIVGVHGRELEEQIRLSTLHPKPRLLLATPAAKKPHTLTLEVALDPASPPLAASSLDLWVVITERGLHSNVTAGENSGETLRHAPVVRQLHKLHSVSLPLKSPLTVPIKLDEKWNSANLSVVVFLSDTHTLQIQAAGSSPL